MLYLGPERLLGERCGTRGQRCEGDEREREWSNFDESARVSGVIVMFRLCRGGTKEGETKGGFFRLGTDH